MTKAITFDFWGTLASANPEYTTARTVYLATLFDMDYVDAKYHYTKIKRHYDQGSEQWGTAATPLRCIEMLIAGMLLTRNVTVADIYFDFINMVIKHPPIIMVETDQLLRRLSSVVPIAIISNTNFIPGTLLRSMLPDVFTWQSFSDQLGFAKPSKSIFQYTINGICQITQRDISANDIHHIGDNVTCDIIGATNVGMSAILTKNPSDTNRIVEKFLQEGYFK